MERKLERIIAFQKEEYKLLVKENELLEEMKILLEEILEASESE